MVRKKPATISTRVTTAKIFDTPATRSSSLDELVGRTAIDDSELRLRNPRLHQLYREIDRLSDEDQKALVILLDSLVKRSQMGKVLAG